MQNGVQLVDSSQGQTNGSLRCQIWAMSRLGKKRLFHFCDCLTCEQASVRLGIAVKEKEVFHVSVRTTSTDALSILFKAPLHRS
jgi:hypothetical protein